MLATLGPMGFAGWPPEAMDFFEGLVADNSKAYWQAHKEEYEQAVLAPMLELIAELSPQFGEGHVFRPYRDVRFSADKSPYKTAIAATIGRGYVQLSADGLGAGAGLHMPAPDQLERYRRAVDDDAAGAELEAIVKAGGESGIEFSAHEKLKTVPRGYAKEHPRAELLRQKGLTAWQQWPPAAWLGTRKAKDRLVKFFSRDGAVRELVGSQRRAVHRRGVRPQALTPGAGGGRRRRADGYDAEKPPRSPDIRRRRTPSGYGRGVRRTARRLG